MQTPDPPHSLHFEAPVASLNRPVAQSMQLSLLPAPLVGKYVPRPHAWGALLPSSQKWPREQLDSQVGVMRLDAVPK